MSDSLRFFWYFTLDTKVICHQIPLINVNLVSQNPGNVTSLFWGSYLKTVVKLFIINTDLHIIHHFNANESYHAFKSNMYCFDKNARCQYLIKGVKGHGILCYFYSFLTMCHLRINGRNVKNKAGN